MTRLVEINFDGIVGPSHNFAGLSPGNLAATASAGKRSQPRRAALEGIAKMRANLALGLVQGVFVPLARPDHAWLDRLATGYAEAPPHLQAQALSASSMWAANAATVSPAPDTRDGRCHLTPANLITMPHRSHEAAGTAAQLRIAFADPGFVIHPPVPAPFGDEGAANHLRLCTDHASPAVEVFVYGTDSRNFPARQHPEASRAVARRHLLDPARTIHVQQSPVAIAAGAFHNDVVAVANGKVLFAHEQAFADRAGFYAQLHRLLPDIDIIEVPASAVDLTDAVSSYLFNAQLVTLPDMTMALICPREVEENPRVHAWLTALVAGNGPIRRLTFVDVRQSMANGGGPACLRLRVVADPARVDQRFLVDDDRLDKIAAIVCDHWPEIIDPDTIGDRALVRAVETARRALLNGLDLVGLIDS